MSIFVEWFENVTCDNCGKENQPHCAQITLEPEATEPIDNQVMLLCGDCVADLKKRLS